MSALEGAFFCIHLTRLGFMPSPHLTGCPLRMHRWQPALGRHRPVSILVASSGCCCRGSRLIWHLPASQSVSAGGSTRAERAGPSVWVGIAGSVDLSSPRWAPPYSSRPRLLSQRGRTCASCRELSWFFYMVLNIGFLNRN